MLLILLSMMINQLMNQITTQTMNSDINPLHEQLMVITENSNNDNNHPYSFKAMNQIKITKDLKKNYLLTNTFHLLLGKLSTMPA